MHFQLRLHHVCNWPNPVVQILEVLLHLHKFLLARVIVLKLQLRGQRYRSRFVFDDMRKWGKNSTPVPLVATYARRMPRRMP